MPSFLDYQEKARKRTRLFVALADNDGAGNHAPEGIVRKLKDIAAVKAFLAFLPEMSANMATAVEYAEKIADYLGIDPPDFDDFDDTRNFIDDNKDDYWREMRENGDI